MQLHNARSQAKSASPHRRLGSVYLMISLCLACCAGRLFARESDVTGTWDLKVESAQGTAAPSMTLKQQGNKLSGTYKGRLGEGKVAGSLNEAHIEFSVTLQFQDQKIVMTYTGTVENTTMRGTVRFGDGGTGGWSARRKPNP